MTRLILIRHGATKWTKQKRYQGKTDIPLSDGGKQQAKKLAVKLKKEKIDIAYASKLKRAIQTAEEIIRLHKIRLIKEEKLNERTYGDWEGLTIGEVKKKYPEDYNAYKKDRYKTRPTNGESFFDLRKKIEPFIKQAISENKNKTILIVSHNGPLRVIVGILMGYTDEEITSLYFKPTSITILNDNNGKFSI